MQITFITQTRFQRTINIFSMSGRVNFEGVDALIAAIKRHGHRDRIVLDMTGLQFVGSIALAPFFSALGTLFALKNEDLLILGAKSEFSKLFQTQDQFRFQIISSLEEANSVQSGAPREFC